MSDQAAAEGPASPGQEPRVNNVNTDIIRGILLNDGFFEGGDDKIADGDNVSMVSQATTTSHGSQDGEDLDRVGTERAKEAESGEGSSGVAPEDAHSASRKRKAHRAQHNEELDEERKRLENELVSRKNRKRLVSQAMRQKIYQPKQGEQAGRVGHTHPFHADDSDESEDEEYMPLMTGLVGRRRKGGKLDIQGATVDRLIEYLTPADEFFDWNFWHVMMWTYRQMLEPVVVFDAIKIRYYDNLMEDGLDEEELRMRAQIQVRAVNFILVWIKDFILDFKENHALRQAAIEFSDTKDASVPPHVAAIKKSIKKRLEKKLLDTVDEDVTVDPIQEMRNKLNMTKSLGSVDLSSISHKELAQQVTIIESDLFKELDTKSLRMLIKKDKMQENKPADVMIQHFNTIADWIATEVVSMVELKPRIEILYKFILAAQYCFEIQNFNTTLEIMMALDKTPIQRLRTTWKGLERKHESAFMSWLTLKQIFSPRQNFRNYRIYLDSIKTLPTLPYMGQLVSDISITQELQKDWYDKEAKIVNVIKMRMIHEKIKDIQYYQNSDFKFKKDTSVQFFLLVGSIAGPLIFTEDEMYEASYEAEPKGSGGGSSNSRSPYNSRNRPPFMSLDSPSGSLASSTDQLSLYGSNASLTSLNSEGKPKKYSFRKSLRKTFKSFQKTKITDD